MKAQKRPNFSSCLMDISNLFVKLPWASPLIYLKDSDMLMHLIGASNYSRIINCLTAQNQADIYWVCTAYRVLQLKFKRSVFNQVASHFASIHEHSFCAKHWESCDAKSTGSIVCVMWECFHPTLQSRLCVHAYLRRGWRNRIKAIPDQSDFPLVIHLTFEILTSVSELPNFFLCLPDSSPKRER